MTNDELSAATIAVRQAFDESGLTDKFRLGSFATDIAKAALQAAETIRSLQPTKSE